MNFARRFLQKIATFRKTGIDIQGNHQRAILRNRRYDRVEIRAYQEFRVYSLLLSCAASTSSASRPVSSCK